MDFLEILKAIILGIIQGITEWLPISSTGHMILANEFIKLKASPEFTEMFFVVIQFGSILAVLVLFFHKLNPFSARKTQTEKMDTISLWLKVIVAAVPAGILGILFNDQIDLLFYHSVPIAIALIFYGVMFILLENRKQKPRIKTFAQLDYKTSLLIGVCQVLALIPGTSRSGATILGAVFFGTSRYIAAEFSFFLAIPIMFGASALKLLKFGFDFKDSEIAILLTGMIVAFIVSIFAIKLFVNYIKKHDFKVFGYYRIILGIVVLLYFLFLSV